MEGILQKLKLKKVAPVLLDSDGKPIVFQKTEPKWKTILKNPAISARKYKEKLIEKHKYGPPYEQNLELAREFLEESVSPHASLMSIHECLSGKIDPNICNKAHCNNRAMHYAARRGNVNFGRLLIRAKADVNLKNSLGMTPLMVASAGKFSGHTDFVRFLIENGAEVNEKDRGGSTALVQATINTCVNNVGVLLHHGATVIEPKHAMFELDVPQALSIGKFLRAKDEGVAGADGDNGDEYFELLKITGPGLIDRICSIGLCRPSAVVVDMLEKAAENKYLNYYEISKENYANLFRHILHHLGIKKIKKEVVVIKKKEKVLQVQKLDDSVRVEAINARRRARKLKKELEMKAIDSHNLNQARREMMQVGSKEAMEALYKRTNGGEWVDKVDKLEGKEKSGNRTKGRGRSEVKKQYVFQEVTADRSLGVGFKKEVFIGKSQWEKDLETAEERDQVSKFDSKTTKTCVARANFSVSNLAISVLIASLLFCTSLRSCITDCKDG